jgi:hypothetical protein
MELSISRSREAVDIGNDRAHLLIGQLKLRHLNPLFRPVQDDRDRPRQLQVIVAKGKITPMAWTPRSLGRIGPTGNDPA